MAQIPALGLFTAGILDLDHVVPSPPFIQSMPCRLLQGSDKGYFLRTEPPEAKQFRVFIFQVNNTPNYIQDLVSNFILFFFNVDHF